MDRGVHIVIQIAEVFKGGRPIVRLCKLIVDVVKLDALGIAAFCHPANAVREHIEIGNAVLRRVRLAVAFVSADNGFNFPPLGAGQLSFFLWLLYRVGQSLLPPVP